MLGGVIAFRERTRQDWDSRRSNSNDSAAQQQQPKRERDFLEARQVSLYELFDGNNFLLDVPEYQRPYAWRAKQVQELLSDLQQAFASNQEHFLGAIVTTRRGDAPGEPYSIIDGQQRLTTLIMLLSYLRAWSATQPGLDSLTERVHRMLSVPADPLNPASTSRYRLQLRSADQQFFAANFIHAYLPTRYYLTMKLDSPANAAGDYHEAAHQLHQQQQQRKRRRSSNSSGQTDAAAATPQQQQQAAAAAARSSGEKDGGTPLDNETWWRLYCAGDVVACHLSQAIEGGLNMQDFAHHVLRNCMVVFMVARDEHTSFKIFSTLNGRGVDLAVMDKLKPELLQALPAKLRQEYADRWAALESSLGRPSFHALFDHYVVIEHAAAGAGAAPQGQQQQQQQQQQHGSNHCNDGSSGSSSGGVAPGARGFVPPGSSLSAQLHDGEQGGTSAAAAAAGASGGSSSSPSGLPVLARPDVLEHFSGHRDVLGAVRSVFEYGQRLLQIRANDWSALAAEGGSAPGIAAELEEACFFINLLSDHAWQPWVLEFFTASEDDAKRAAFLRGAELLQLYCGLKQDEAFKQARWLVVGRMLLQRPFYSDQVLAALALSPDEADDFIKLLDRRELAASVDEGLLVHLLLRADSINRKTLDWRRLKVEKIMPSNPPERSPWRKQKLLLPALSPDELTASSSSSSSSSSLFSPASRGRGSSSGGGSRGSSSSSSGGSSGGQGGRQSRGRTTSISSSGGTGGRSPPGGSYTSVDDATAAPARSSNGSSSDGGGSGSSNVPRGMREVRYWHEITRAHWHNRLGNQVLLAPSGHEATASAAATATTSHLSSDLPTKLAYYAACAADECFPDFTGGLVHGRYSRDMFSPEECRQRHADIISQLIVVFGLPGAEGGGGL